MGLLSLLTSLIFSFSLPVYGAQSPIVTPESSPGWGIGIGFGVEALYKSVSVIEVKTPSLFKFGQTDSALVLSAETKEIAQTEKGIFPVHLLLDFSYAPYRDIVKSYFRIGGGSVFVHDDVILVGQEQIFNFQVQFGAELITFRGYDSSYGAFFVQVMLNSPAIRQPPVGGFDIFGGNSLVVGVRNYF